MDELANSTGPRTDILTTHCREFMQSIKVSLFPALWIYWYIYFFFRFFSGKMISWTQVTKRNRRGKRGKNLGSVSMSLLWGRSLPIWKICGRWLRVDGEHGIYEGLNVRMAVSFILGMMQDFSREEGRWFDVWWQGSGLEMHRDGSLLVFNMKLVVKSFYFVSFWTVIVNQSGCFFAHIYQDCSQENQTIIWIKPLGICLKLTEYDFRFCGSTHGLVGTGLVVIPIELLKSLFLINLIVSVLIYFMEI